MPLRCSPGEATMKLPCQPVRLVGISRPDRELHYAPGSPITMIRRRPCLEHTKRLSRLPAD